MYDMNMTCSPSVGDSTTTPPQDGYRSSRNPGVRFMSIGRRSKNWQEAPVQPGSHTHLPVRREQSPRRWQSKDVVQLAPPGIRVSFAIRERVGEVDPLCRNKMRVCVKPTVRSCSRERSSRRNSRARGARGGGRRFPWGKRAAPEPSQLKSFTESGSFRTSSVLAREPPATTDPARKRKRSCPRGSDPFRDSIQNGNQQLAESLQSLTGIPGAL